MAEMHIPAQYLRIRARLDELYGREFKDRAASLAASGGKNVDMLRNIKRGRMQQPRGQDLVGLAVLLKKPVDWITRGPGQPVPAANETSDEAIISRTKRARVAAGLSPLQVSEALGISIESYLDFEASHPIPHRFVGPFCSLTRITADWLFTGRSQGQTDGSNTPRHPDGSSVSSIPAEHLVSK